MTERFDNINEGPKNADEGSAVEREISISRGRIQPNIESVPIEENGFFMLNGELYGTVTAWSERHGISYHRIYKEIRKNNIRPTIGRTRLGLIGRYYPERIFKGPIHDIENAQVENEHKANITEEKEVVLNQAPDKDQGVKAEAVVPEKNIEPVITKVVIEGPPYAENGFLRTKDGKCYGTVRAWSERFGIPQYKIFNRIQQEKIESVVHTDSFGRKKEYFPEINFVVPQTKKVEEKEKSSTANEQGYFLLDNQRFGTLDFWVHHYNLEKTTFEAQVRKLRAPSKRGKTFDQKPASFYGEDYIEKAIQNWHIAQRDLLYELYTGNKLPRVRIKKRSKLYNALKGDVLLLIPTKYAGIYQWLQKEFHLNPPGEKQVFVLIDKRSGVSVVLKSELEEIR